MELSPMNDEDYKPGMRLRITRTYEATVTRVCSEGVTVRTESGTLYTHLFSQDPYVSVEILPSPPPPEPPQGSYVIDKDGDMWKHDETHSFKDHWILLNNADGMTWENLSAEFGPLTRLYREDDPDITVTTRKFHDFTPKGFP